jgi:hypothetical protein
MGTEKLINPGTNDTQPLTSAAGVAVAAARREPISDQTEIDCERGGVDYQSAAGGQPEEDSPPLFEQDAFEKFRSSWGAIRPVRDNPGGKR